MSEKNVNQDRNLFAFGRINFKLILIGMGIIIVGFLLMVGGGSDDPNVFSEEIFSFRRITLAPLVLILGYGFVFYAILKNHDATE